MPVPRSWWEHAIERGEPPSTEFAGMIRELRDELRKVPSIAAQVDIPELVALAFIDNPDQSGTGFDAVNGDHRPEEYISAAREVLATRPAIAEFGVAIKRIAESV